MFFKASFSPQIMLFALFGLCLPLEVILSRFDFPKNGQNSIQEASIQEIYQSFSSVEWHECNFSTIRSCVSDYPSSSVLLDLSDSSDAQSIISQVCAGYSMIHLVYQDGFLYQNGWTYSVISSETEQLNAFLSVLKYFGWNQGIVISNQYNSNWKEKITENYSGLEVFNVQLGTNIKDFIDKIVFPLGATLYYVFTYPILSSQIQGYMKIRKLLDKGQGIILNQESGYCENNDGALIIVKSGYEFVISKEEYFKKATIDAIYLLEKNENLKDYKEFLNSKLQRSYENQFSLVNIQDGKRVIVGSIINGNVSISGNLNFPGQTSQIPKSTKKLLQLSINAGTTNPGSSPIYNALVGARGTFAIQKKINEGNDILSNFQLDFFTYDCGVTIFNSTFAQACFTKNIDKVGFAHIAGFSSMVAVGTIQLFGKLNISVPIIGAANGDDLLNSTALFPMYSRVQLSQSFICSKYLVVIRGMGWKTAAVLYQKDLWGATVYSLVKLFAEKYGIEILNPEESRSIPVGLDRTHIKNATNQLKKVINSQARLLVLLVQHPLGNYILEWLYDLGARKGDFVICAGFPDLPLFISIQDDYLYKRLETGIPMFTILGETWSEEFGKDIYKRILTNYKSEPNTFSCTYADATYMIAIALDFMINRGLDYTDSRKLMTAIRSTQFHGCTGLVQLEKGSNDRIVDTLIIAGVKLIDETPSLYSIGVFQPFSSKLISIINPMIYADGSTLKPSEYRSSDYDCPFPDREIKSFDKGKGLLFGICFSVALVMIIITFFIWKRWWNVSIEPLITKEEMSIQDLIVGLTIGIEFFQYAAMGPSFKAINTFLSDLSGLLSMKLEDVIKLKNGVFWIVVDFVFGGIGIWVILCAVVILELDDRIRFLSIFRYLRWLADCLMPILGNLCFIPFTSICLDIFQCDESIGDNFTDSFLAKDCYYFCWKGKHLIYAIMSFFALLFYQPLAVYCRPLWQDLQPTLHVFTSPVFLMVKTVIQTTLIVMSITLKRSYAIPHGIIFILIMTAYTVFIFKFKPYNYPRFSWWQGVSMIGVVWLALLSMIGRKAEGKDLSVVLLISLNVGWIIIIGIGFYVQNIKYPSLLYRKKGIDTSHLFKFAFTFGKSSQITLSKISKSSLMKL
ncbi:unnamed protein product [Blepharisma stoltei]|uniref:Receptor ligand binding region domain-containing protein n=1 Tax=Blepharisma stoltei TaxID=1481888 RepID=A0AAU9K6P1_9CILI|nr:unnamed protein product [Blepharisma stoltei]